MTENNINKKQKKNKKQKQKQKKTKKKTEKQNKKKKKKKKKKQKKKKKKTKKKKKKKKKTTTKKHYLNLSKMMSLLWESLSSDVSNLVRQPSLLSFRKQLEARIQSTIIQVFWYLTLKFSAYLELNL